MKFLQMMNRFVSVLLVTVALTAALQFSGVASHAKDSTDYEAMANKKDYASDVIDDIFNIPIATLKAVRELVQTAGPLTQRTPEQRAEARKARAELIKAKADNRHARNDAKALRRRPSVVHTVDRTPIVVSTKDDKIVVA